MMLMGLMPAATSVGNKTPRHTTNVPMALGRMSMSTNAITVEQASSSTFDLILSIGLAKASPRRWDAPISAMYMENATTNRMMRAVPPSWVPKYVGRYSNTSNHMSPDFSGILSVPSAAATRSATMHKKHSVAFMLSFLNTAVNSRTKMTTVASRPMISISPP